MPAATLVVIVDDDESTRRSLPNLVRQFGFRVCAFASAEEFLGSDCIEQTKCLILDISMPGMSGPELQSELARRGQRIPVIFITGQADEDLRRQLLADGAAECLSKPLSPTVMLKALNTALGVN